MDGEIISNYRVLRGNFCDEGQWTPSLARHQELFGHTPHQASADWGVYSLTNEDRAQKMGVQSASWVDLYLILPNPCSHLLISDKVY